MERDKCCLVMVLLLAVVTGAYVNATPSQYDTVILNLSATTTNVTMLENAMTDSTTSVNYTFTQGSEEEFEIQVPVNITLTNAIRTKDKVICIFNLKAFSNCVNKT